MALVIADRVRETTTSTGTGDIALGGAVVGYQSFALGIGASNATYYVIADQNGANWECGFGTLDATGTILSRTTVLASSNSNTLVTFGSGTKDVFCSLLASKIIYKNEAGAPVGAGTVTSASVATANGFAGTVTTPGTTPVINMTVTFSGLAKGNGTSLSAAVAGTDYLAPPAGTALLKANSGGALANAVAGTDYLAPPSGSAVLKANAGGALANAVAGTDYAPATSGTAILKGNNSGGFAAAVAKTDYAPATSGSAILKGDGLGGFSSAAAGTDYAPATTGTAILKASGSGGFSAAVPNADYQAAITASGLLKGAGSGSVSTALAGTDYLAPPSGTAIQKANSGGALVDAIANTDYVAPAGSDGLLSRWMFQDTGWDWHDSGTTNALNYMNGSAQRWTPTASSNPTLTIASWPPSGAMGELLIEGVNLGAAGTIAFPTANWIKSDGTFAASPSAANVTLQSTGTDFILFWTRDAGTTLYAKVIR